MRGTGREAIRNGAIGLAVILALCLAAGVWLSHLTRGGREPARLIGQMGHSVDMDLPPPEAVKPKAAVPAVVAPADPTAPAPRVAAPVPQPLPAPVVEAPVVRSSADAGEHVTERAPDRPRHEHRRDREVSRDRPPVKAATPAPTASAPETTRAEPTQPVPEPVREAPKAEAPRTETRTVEAPPVAQTTQSVETHPATAAAQAPESGSGVKPRSHRRTRKVEDSRIRDALETVRPM